MDYAASSAACWYAASGLPAPSAPAASLPAFLPGVDAALAALEACGGHGGRAPSLSLTSAALSLPAYNAGYARAASAPVPWPWTQPPPPAPAPAPAHALPPLHPLLQPLARDQQCRPEADPGAGPCFAQPLQPQPTAAAALPTHMAPTHMAPTHMAVERCPAGAVPRVASAPLPASHPLVALTVPAQAVATRMAVERSKGAVTDQLMMTRDAEAAALASLLLEIAAAPWPALHTYWGAPSAAPPLQVAAAAAAGMDVAAAGPGLEPRVAGFAAAAEARPARAPAAVAAAVNPSAILAAPVGTPAALVAAAMIELAAPSAAATAAAAASAAASGSRELPPTPPRAGPPHAAHGTSNMAAAAAAAAAAAGPEEVTAAANAAQGLVPAAKRLGMGGTQLKRRCRALGIRRWPQRKLASLARVAEAVAADVGLAAEQREELLRSVTLSRADIQRDPDAPLRVDLAAYRQGTYRATGGDRSEGKDGRRGGGVGAQGPSSDHAASDLD
ncbi:hypothetical protein HYH03_011539 [Edaphochlamys debaryana]|uniref:RWP-RK domain-containing protein n=1 Tax=Edaphochlamys debaryana TaxID=47281 RepID=A0A836BWG0_9CHLO|nr:hypothetical protein HYH03_011539 [Edaphochlamys debaryana]|eukprot:KAG2490074.1 hypothetical protein HYH03_011539 [Edaphochlamys debaryana]